MKSELTKQSAVAESTSDLPPSAGLRLGSPRLLRVPPFEPDGGQASATAAAPLADALSTSDGSTLGTNRQVPSEHALVRVERLIASYTEKSGTHTHPDPTVTESVKLGLAAHIDELKRPLCPCRFYPDKAEEAKHRTWMCPCDDMQVYKYCHCLLFTRDDGKPITEHLPPDHEGRRIWGNVADPDPTRGRGLKERAAEREEERKRRPS